MTARPAINCPRSDLIGKVIRLPHITSSPATLSLTGRAIPAAARQIGYGLHISPVAPVLLFHHTATNALAGLAFVPAASRSRFHEVIAEYQQRWPGALLCPAQTETAALVQQIFAPTRFLAAAPKIDIALTGSDFELAVWRALLTIAPGTTTTYSDIATTIGRPRASRAVANAIGRNPVAYVIPCHRVIRKDGRPGGYHWGADIKHALLTREQKTLPLPVR